jgi:hypothetical protein
MKDRMHPSRSQGNVLEQFLTLFQRNSGLPSTMAEAIRFPDRLESSALAMATFTGAGASRTA